MARFRLKLHLPSFKATVRSIGEGTSERTIERSRRIPTSEDDLKSLEVSTDKTDTAEAQASSSLYINTVADNPELKNEPTLHEIKQKANVKGWAEIRQDMLKAAIQCCAMPLEQVCVHCTIMEAKYRCLQCSSWAYYCDECFGGIHHKSNLFHVGEVWEVRQLVCIYVESHL